MERETDVPELAAALPVSESPRDIELTEDAARVLVRLMTEEG